MFYFQLRERKVSWALWCWVKWGGFARATLLLVDISKVKLLKGNSTSKTNRKWALGWLTDGSGVCACVCSPRVCVCVHCLKIIFPWEGKRERRTHTCVSILVPLCLTCQVKSLLFLCFVNKNCVQVSGSKHLHLQTWQLHTWLSFWAPWWWQDWFQ